MSQPLIYFNAGKMHQMDIIFYSPTVSSEYAIRFCWQERGNPADVCCEIDPIAVVPGPDVSERLGSNGMGKA